MSNLIKFVLTVFIVFDVLMVTKLYFVPKPVQVSVTVSITPTPTPLPKNVSADKLFQLVNEWRVKEGYQPYTKSEFACNVANQRLPEITEKFSHDGFYYKRFCESCTLGENLAEGYYTEDQTLTAWVNSPSHLANLQRSYTHSCIVSKNNYTVQIFSYF